MRLLIVVPSLVSGLCLIALRVFECRLLILAQPLILSRNFLGVSNAPCGFDASAARERNEFERWLSELLPKSDSNSK